MKTLKLKFINFTVHLKSESEDLVNLLSKDFSCFVTNEKTNFFNFQIEVKFVQEVESYIPLGLVSNKQSSRAISYNDKSLRYNYFYGKALSVMDYKKNLAIIYVRDFDICHEVLFLLILSRQTKFHDSIGLHKVHAFAISNKKCNLIGMMDSKGGKSTLFSMFIGKKDINLISDDSPIIDRSGVVYPFPIRFGFEPDSISHDILKEFESHFYEFNRTEYDKKLLVDILAFPNMIETKAHLKKNILFQGKRAHCSNCTYKKISKIKMIQYVFKNMIIGKGLPMVIEYYLENTLFDMLKNFKTFFSRSISGVRLVLKSSCYEVYMSWDTNENFEVINSILENEQRDI